MIGFKGNGQKKILSLLYTLEDIPMLVLLLMMERLLLWQVFIFYFLDSRQPHKPIHLLLFSCCLCCSHYKQSHILVIKSKVIF